MDIERLAQRLDQVLATRPRDPLATSEVLERAVAACRTEPDTAAEVFDLVALLDELAEVYGQQGRTDDALAAMRQAIEAGYRGRPDARCRLAEINLRGGRTELAHGLFAQVQADTPDEVWLYNNAGLEYGAAGDHARAVRWLTEGLRLALDTGDPERLVAQLAELRAASLAALDCEPDLLQARAEVFLAAPSPSAEPWQVPDRPARPGRARLGLGWFPRQEFTAAPRTWPHLAQSWGSTDHGVYNRQLQRHLVELTEFDSAMGDVWIVPIELEVFHGWCGRTGHDPATAAARSAYAAQQLRGQADGLISWPPERNAACWCASGRKYKKCCGHPTALTIRGPDGQ